MYVCAFIVVCAPLVQHSGLLFTNVFTKAIVFQIAVQIMVSAWIVLASIDPSYRPAWRHPMVAAAVLFSLALLFTLPFSIDPSRSFWSDQSRMMGVVNIWHMIALFLAVGTVWRTRREWTVLLCSSNAVGVIIAVIGVKQWWTHDSNFRAASLLGNPVFFAAYALLQVFVAVALWRTARGAWRKVAVASVCLNLVAVFITASRGAWVALFASVAIGSVFLLRHFVTKRRAVIASVLMIILSGVAVAGIRWVRSPFGSAWVQAHAPYVLYRPFMGSFGNDRIALWHIALQGFVQRPWVGWGLEQYPVVYNTFVEPNGRDRALQELWYDRSHNQYLDLLVAVGLVGFLPYLLLWIATGWCVWRAVHDLQAPREMREMRAVLGVGLLAYLLFNVFLFDTPMVAATAFLLLSFFLDATCNRALPFPVPIRVGRPFTPRLFVILSVAVLTIVTEVYVNVLPYRSAIINKQALAVLGPENALVLFQKAFAVSTMVDYTNRYLLIDAVSKLVDNGAWRSPSVRRLTAFTAEQLAVNAHDSPGDFKAVMASANAERLNSAFEPSALDRERKLGEQARKLSPWRPESYLILSDVATQSGRHDEALELIAKARSFANNPNALSRADFQQALVQGNIGAWDRAMTALELARKEGYPIFFDIRLALLMDHFSFLEKDVVAKAAAYAEEVSDFYPTRLDLIAIRAKMQNLNGNSLGAHLLFDLFKKHAPAEADQLRKDLGWKE